MNAKILLMYITHGSGHHSATLAIEKAIKSMENHPEILNINGFNYSHPIMEKVTHAVYMSVINKAPRIWDSIYDNPSFASKISNIKETIHRRSRNKIKRLVESENCKVVICSQAFPCGLVADYKKHNKTDLKLIAVVTDFIPHSYWVYDEIDFYIVGSDDAKETLINRGVPEDKIKLFGIPIDPKFSKVLDKQATANELNISLDKPTVLIMGGGRGLGPIKELIRGFEKVDICLNLLVVTGMNKNLFNFLKIVKSKHNLQALSHVDYIDKLMTLADILITKPGGVTAAEALAKLLPMIIMNPLPGQEQKNTKYLLKKEVIKKAKDSQDVINNLNLLLANSQELEKLKEKITHLSFPHSAINVAKLALSLC